MRKKKIYLKFWRGRKKNVKSLAYFPGDFGRADRKIGSKQTKIHLRVLPFSLREDPILYSGTDVWRKRKSISSIKVATQTRETWIRGLPFVHVRRYVRSVTKLEIHAFCHAATFGRHTRGKRVVTGPSSSSQKNTHNGHSAGPAFIFRMFSPVAESPGLLIKDTHDNEL